jgi:hypothetical protein
MVMRLERAIRLTFETDIRRSQIEIVNTIERGYRAQVQLDRLRATVRTIADELGDAHPEYANRLSNAASDYGGGA